jgi:CheY-like chemotaxis protein
MKILIVDDNEINVMLLEEVLKEKGYETYSFMDPIDALKSLDTNQKDEVLKIYNKYKD